MWPSVLVMSVTVSNGSLELLAVTALWRADSQRDERWLLLSGLVFGLGVLTKFTVVARAPLPAFVAVRHVAEAPSRTRVAVAAAACVIPLVTPSGVARDMQEGVSNPEGLDFGLGTFWTGIPDLLC